MELSLIWDQRGLSDLTLEPVNKVDGINSHENKYPRFCRYTVGLVLLGIHGQFDRTD